MKEQAERIGVVGLGYVGLPLAVAFSQHFAVVGYDRSESRVEELRAGRDHTHEVAPESLAAGRLAFCSDPASLGDCTFIVVAVPTPITRAREPDLRPLEDASATVGKILSKGAAVVYESTVYPGVTEDICLPLLEEHSGMKLGEFALGYSPERINPGDAEHRVSDIVKVVSGHDSDTLERVARVYGRIITAGVHKASNIKTAEASKVIENVQRDLNIALMNELSKIFARVGIRTSEVLDAAATKWNFHRYSPGLVGGHCIGVDPYYLTHLALELGYHPEVILAGRRINDSMGTYVGDQAIRAMSAAGVVLRNAHAWVLGLTFKENVPDCRNTKAVDVIQYMKGFGVRVSAWEPLVPEDTVRSEFDVDTLTYEDARELDAVIVVNGHDEFKSIDLAALRSRMRTPVLVDVRNFFDADRARDAGLRYVAL